MAYLPKLNPTVGGGLGGLPERRATGGAASANSVQRSIIGQAVKGSLAYRNTTTGDTYSLDPMEGLWQENTVTMTSKLNQSGIDIKMFNDGKYVIAYTETASNSTAFEVYNFDGTISVSQVIVESATSGGRRLAIGIDPSTENINIFYHQGTSSTVVRHAVYSKSGTVVVAAYTILSAQNASDIPDILAVDFWNDGWFVLGTTRSASTDNYINVFNASRALQAQYTYTFDFTGGRLAVCCMETATKTFAYTYSSSGGLTSTAGRGFVQIARFDGVNISNTYNSFLGNIGGTGYSKTQICYNEIEKEVVTFYASENNYVTMTPTELYYKNNNTQFAPTKMKMLEYSLPTNLTATSLGGDRFMVTYGGNGGGDPLYAGIINSLGDWIGPPTLVRARATGDSTYGYCRAASCKALGLAIVAIPIGTTLYLRTFRYRNTASETYRLSDQYPVKIGDFNPYCDNSYNNPFNINAQQATNKFVMAWTQNSNDITWAIYSSGGTLQSGPFINTAISGGNNINTQIKALLLPNGNVALIAQVGTIVKFGIYNSSGVLQGSITTVSSTATTVVAEVATNGNFVIAWRNNSNGFAHYTCYNQSGASQGTAAISSSATNNDTFKIIYSALNDTFMFVAQESATNYYYFSIRLNTGAQSVGFQSLGNVGLNKIALCCNPDGTWSFAMITSGHRLYFRKLTAGGLNSVAITDTSIIFTTQYNSSYQLLPYTNSEIMMIHTSEFASTTNCIKLSNTDGRPSSTTKSFSISSAWYERYFQLYDASPNKYRNDVNSGAVSVSVSLNGDQYIATAWGDIYRLSSAVATGDYVIDGIVNTDVINGTAEVITNGNVTRVANLPRNQAIINNGSASKKIIASKNSIFASS